MLANIWKNALLFVSNLLSIFGCCTLGLDFEELLPRQKLLRVYQFDQLMFINFLVELSYRLDALLIIGHQQGLLKQLHNCQGSPKHYEFMQGLIRAVLVLVGVASLDEH
jgi:hypothetical protein